MGTDADDRQAANRLATQRITRKAKERIEIRLAITRGSNGCAASAFRAPGPSKTAWIVTRRGTGGKGVKHYLGFRATIA